MIKSPPIGLLTIELHFPQAGSLKERRKYLSSIVNRVRSRYNVSVAEVGDSDKWQLATITICAVTGSPGETERQLQSIFTTIDEWQLAEIINHRLELV